MSDIKCPTCVKKVIAKERDGKIYVWCKECKKEVELLIMEWGKNERNASSQ